MTRSGVRRGDDAVTLVQRVRGVGLRPVRRRDRVQRLDGQRAAGRLGGQEVQLVQLLARHRLELREQRAHRLADARGRLRQQRATQDRGLVDVLRELTLAGAEVRVRERQRGERRIARDAVRRLLRGPGQEALALLLEEGAQVGGGAGLDQQRLVLRVDVVVDERHVQPGKAALRAQQCAVAPGLRPVQRAPVLRHGMQVAAVGLDLLQATGVGVEPVGAAAHHEVAVPARQPDLRLVALAAPRRDHGMARHALQRGGRGREAQVEIPLLGSELAKGADGDRVCHSLSIFPCPRSAMRIAAPPSWYGQRGFEAFQFAILVPMWYWKIRQRFHGRAH